MRIILCIIGLIAPVFMIKYREGIGDILGDAEWMHFAGGIYNIIVISAVFIFFFSLASLTGTTTIFLSPLRFLLPGNFQLPTEAF